MLKNVETERIINLMFLPSFEKDDIKKINYPDKYFGALLMVNVNVADMEKIKKLSKELLKNGCIYFDSWGNQCKKVHDIFDKKVREFYPANKDGSTILTTCYDKLSLEKALWNFLNCSFPDIDFKEKCTHELIIIVQNMDWNERVQKYISNQEQLNELIKKEKM